MQRSVATILLVALMSAAGASGYQFGVESVASASTERILCRAEPLPFGTGSCPGVRPGALFYSGNSACTLNFLFQGSDGHRYIGTAGHCTLDSEGETAWVGSPGPSAADRDRTRFGSFAYAVLKGPKDFALIRIDKGVKAEPGMCYFGGPTGMYDDFSPDPVELHFFGNGDAVGNIPVVNQPVLPARTSMAYDTMDPDQVIAGGVANFGDSGSGVISDDGRAVGVLVAISPLQAGDVITRLGPQLKRAEQKLGIRLRLLTAGLEN